MTEGTAELKTASTHASAEQIGQSDQRGDVKHVILRPRKASSASADGTMEMPAKPNEEIKLRYDHPCAAHCVIDDARDGRVSCRPVRKKVAIVGFATSSYSLAPFDDPEYEIWGLNQLYRFIPRADRWFDIHRDFMSAVAEGTDYWGWLTACEIPIYMVDTHAPIPMSVRYPIERMIEHYGQDYFTSTIAYALALAIYEGFTTIALYGIDLVVGKEYIDQRPCAEFYIGWACAKGVTVEIPKASALCKQRYRYGYQDEPEGPIRVHDLLERRRKIADEREKLYNRFLQLDGALMDLNFFLQGAELRERGAEWNP